MNKKLLLSIPAGGLAIIASVFAIEGGYVYHPSDPGGATNHGITEKVARADGYTGHMRAFPKSWAQSIVWRNYIERPGFAPIIGISLPVAEEVIDSGVNAGTVQPSRWFQIALNSLNRRQRDYSDIAVDGKLGPATLAAYRRLETVRGRVKACQMMVKLLDAQQAGHYLRLANDNSAYEEFMPGWVDNRLGNVDFRICGKAQA